MNIDKLPNRQCCEYCWEKTTMCDTCYKKTLRPEKPTIDWKKPIRNAHNLSNSVQLVGSSQNRNYVVEEWSAGSSYFTIVSQVTGEKIGDRNSSNFLLENIPEPKKELWVNLYWNKREKAVKICSWPTKLDAGLNFMQYEDTKFKSIGTFQVE